MSCYKAYWDTHVDGFSTWCWLKAHASVLCGDLGPVSSGKLLWPDVDCLVIIRDLIGEFALGDV